MTPGLFRLDTDFGNGRRDSLVVQVDEQYPSYIAAKSRAISAFVAPQPVVANTNGEREAHATALEWLRASAEVDGPASAIKLPGPLTLDVRDPATGEALGARWQQLTQVLQEDAILMYRRAGSSLHAIAAPVCFPTAWRPESIVGTDFGQIHARVPDFAKREEVTWSLENTIVERGPFVRFVWTVCPDDRLDRHPDRLPKTSWSDAEGGWLRVERQVSVPLPRVRACLFLIRVYHYAFERLGDPSCRILREALARTTEPILRYKRLWNDRELIRERLDPSATTPPR